MTAYEAEPWHELFAASAGSAAALAGLVFVAVSINIKAILQSRGLPERGLQTVLLLLGAVVVSIFGLAPQSIDAFAIETAAVGGALVVFLTVTLSAVVVGGRDRAGLVATRLLVVIPGSVGYIVAGVSVLVERGGGLFWVLFAIVGALVGAVINAWVLLVEILR